MRMSSGVRAVAILALAVVLAACNSRRTPSRQETAQSGEHSAPAAALVAVSGCLAEAAGTNSYVLRNVRFEPRASDPHVSTTTPGSHGITEGAWVRVSSDGHDLTPYLGQRVMVKGTMVDSGRNTIGTAGTAGNEAPNGDKSQAAGKEHYAEREKKEMGRIARESMADGTAAQIRVQEVVPAGERCADTTPNR